MIPETIQKIKAHLNARNRANERRMIFSGRNEALKKDIMPLLPDSLTEYEQYQFLEHLQQAGYIKKVDGCVIVFSEDMVKMNTHKAYYHHGLGAIN